MVFELDLNSIGVLSTRVELFVVEGLGSEFFVMFYRIWEAISFFASKESSVPVTVLFVLITVVLLEFMIGVLIGFTFVVGSTPVKL